MPQRAILEPPEERVSVLNGYLFKMKRKQNKYSLSAWSKRWFSIEGDKLLWYGRKGSREPNNFISLVDITSIKEFEAGQDGTYSFQIRSAERNFFLRTKSEKDLNRWIRALKMHRDLWKKQAEEKKSSTKPRKKMSQVDYKALEVDKISAEVEALAQQVLRDQEKKKRCECSGSSSTTSSQSSRSSSRRNSFTSTSSSSSLGLDERRADALGYTSETKPPSNKDRESPSPHDRSRPPSREASFRERERPGPSREVHVHDSRHHDGYRQSPPKSWERESYRRGKDYDYDYDYGYDHNRETGPSGYPCRGNASYNQHHSGRSHSPTEDDDDDDDDDLRNFLYESGGHGRFNSGQMNYGDRQTCMRSNRNLKPKSRPLMVDTRVEDHFQMHSPGTPVSKCWGDPSETVSKPTSGRAKGAGRSAYSQPEVDDGFVDCRDPTFDDPEFCRPGTGQSVKSNWVDEMWDSDEE